MAIGGVPLESSGAVLAQPFDDVLDGVLAGDQRALCSLVDRFRADMVDYAARNQAPDPEGVVDLVITRVLRRLPALEDVSESGLETYLYRSLRRELNREVARSRQARVVEIGDGPDGVVPAFEDAVADADYVDSLLGGLSSWQRQVVVEHFINDRSYEDIGLEAGQSSSAVRKTSSRAISKLRAALAAALVAAVVALLALRGTPDTVVETGPIDDVGRTADSEAPPDQTDGTDETGDTSERSSGRLDTRTATTASAPDPDPDDGPDPGPGPDDGGRPAAPVDPAPTDATTEGLDRSDGAPAGGDEGTVDGSEPAVEPEPSGPAEPPAPTPTPTSAPAPVQTSTTAAVAPSTTSTTAATSTTQAGPPPPPNPNAVFPEADPDFASSFPVEFGPVYFSRPNGSNLTTPERLELTITIADTGGRTVTVGLLPETPGAIQSARSSPISGSATVSQWVRFDRPMALDGMRLLLHDASTGQIVVSRPLPVRYTWATANPANG